jgi:hypothetical protein
MQQDAFYVRVRHLDRGKRQREFNQVAWAKTG